MTPTKSNATETPKSRISGEVEKSGLADHIWKEIGNHLPLCNQPKIFDRKESWKVKRLKEVTHMLSNNDLLSRISIEMNTIWEPLIKMAP